MERLFITHVRRHSDFGWGRMGDLERGRPALGPTAAKSALHMQNAALMRTLSARCGKRQAREAYRAAGRLAGAEMAMHDLALEDEAEAFFEGLARVMWVFRLGMLMRVQWDDESGEAVFEVGQGLMEGEVAGACYLQGLLAGVMDVWTGQNYRCSVETREDTSVELYRCTPGEGQN